MLAQLVDYTGADIMSVAYGMILLVNLEYQML